jgi:DNA-binding beta-propeller fold protein YncE
MTEKYTPLKLMKVVGPEIAPDVFIYKPTSLTLDREGNLYIFDQAQHQIFKLDKNLKFIRTIGRDGQGPGEFSAGRGMIKIGPDNKLYVNDTWTQRITVFDTNGKYINDHPVPGILWGKSTVDNNGNIYLFKGNDQEISAKNQKGELILKIPVEAKKVYSFLFERQYLHRNMLSRYFMTTFLQPDHLLLYFEPSSVMLDISKNKIKRYYQILPKDLLDNYSRSVEELVKKNDKGRYPLFSKIIVDHSENECFYLPVVINKTTNRSLVYKINTKGELDKTFYVDYKDVAPYVWVEAIHKGLFYARLTEEQLIGIFKEN